MACRQADRVARFVCSVVHLRKGGGSWLGSFLFSSSLRWSASCCLWSKQADTPSNRSIGSASCNVHLLLILLLQDIIGTRFQLLGLAWMKRQCCHHTAAVSCQGWRRKGRGHRKKGDQKEDGLVGPHGAGNDGDTKNRIVG